MPVLSPIIRDDIFHCGVAEVAYRKYNGLGRCARDSAEVDGKGEDRPVIGDSPEVRVLCVGERAIIDELSAENNILSSLESRASALNARISKMRL